MVPKVIEDFKKALATEIELIYASKAITDNNRVITIGLAVRALERMCIKEYKK